MSRPELLEGYSSDVVDENTKRLTYEKRTEPQARAIARRMARKQLRNKLENEGAVYFTAGKYPGKLTVSEGDLDNVVQTYNEQQAQSVRTAAAVKHTHESGKPALGWVEKLSRKGRDLIAFMRNTKDELLDGIIDETYPNPSIELRKNLVLGENDFGLSLKAIAMLGADPPAVKSVPAFSEDDDGEETICLSLSEISTGGKGTMPDKDPQQVEIIVKGAAAPEPKPADAPETFSEDDVKAREAATAKATREKVEAEYAEKAAKVATERHDKDATAFTEQLVKDGKLAPKDRDFTLALLKNTGESVEFGEGDKKSSLYADLKAKLGSAEESELFGEPVTPKGDKGLEPNKGSDKNSEKRRNARIEKFATENKLSFSEAAERCSFGYDNS